MVGYESESGDPIHVSIVDGHRFQGWFRYRDVYWWILFSLGVPKIVRRFPPREGSCYEAPGEITSRREPLDPPEPFRTPWLIRLAIDQQLVDSTSRIGLDAFAVQEAVLHSVNGFLGDQLGVSFRIRSQDLVDLGETRDGQELLLALRSWSQTEHGDLRLAENRRIDLTDLVHLTTGRKMAGGELGRAFRPGVYGYSSIDSGGLSGGASFIEDVFGDTGAKPAIVMGHEIGHNLGGRHDRAAEYCVTRVIVCTDYERSLMWPQAFDDTRSELTPANLVAMERVAREFRLMDFR